MRPAFAGHPVASVLLFATLAVWLILELRQGLTRRPGAHSTDRGSVQVLRVAGIAGGVLAVLAVQVRATAFPYSSAMDDAQLPEDPEFRKAMCDYIHWATREVNSYSPRGSTVKPNLSMPRWSWQGLEET